mmetsp:Transcript_133179/g.249057  ORF Transcript_133179/g.249057 Transcript_133179/m.249057 type:complete len:122 (+) Transcript_133179:177-542(+)
MDNEGERSSFMAVLHSVPNLAFPCLVDMLLIGCFISIWRAAEPGTSWHDGADCISCHNVILMDSELRLVQTNTRGDDENGVQAERDIKYAVLQPFSDWYEHAFLLPFIFCLVDHGSSSLSH